MKIKEIEKKLEKEKEKEKERNDLFLREQMTIWS